MTAPVHIRAGSGSSVAWRAREREAGTTTARWQDKRAHGAPWSVGCFCSIFRRVAHRAGFARTVRNTLNLLCPRDFSHCAVLRHGR